MDWENKISESSVERVPQSFENINVSTLHAPKLKPWLRMVTRSKHVTISTLVRAILIQAQEDYENKSERKAKTNK